MKLAVFIALLTIPAFAFADVEGSLQNIRTQLTGTILPLLSVIGLGIASISFFTGNPQAKQHVVYAILGCVFGFGAQQIVDLIARMVR
jgi:type IV secretory pathway VirB2 component (pilin)